MKQPSLLATSLVVLGILIALAIWFRRGRAPLDAKHEEPPTQHPEISSPTITRIRRTPQKTLEITWEFDSSLEPLIDGFIVKVSGPDGVGRPLSAKLQPGERHYTDSRSHQPGELIGYYVTAIARDKQFYNSVEEDTTWQDYEVPPKPSGLGARLITIAGRAFVDLTWTGATPSDTLTEGYSLMADLRTPGQYDNIVPLSPPLRIPRLVVPMQTDVPREVRFRVVSVGRLGQESEAVELLFACPATRLPAPESLTSTRGDTNGAPVVIRWTYDLRQAVQGFRLYNHGLLLAAESKLTASTRQWLVTNPIPSVTNVYSLEAISTNGLLSERVIAEPFLVKPNPGELAPPKPGGFVAVWMETNGSAQVELTWNPGLAKQQIQGYFLVYRQGTNLPFTRIPASGVLPVSPTRYLYTPEIAGTNYVFQLYCVSLTGEESKPAEVRLLAPGALLSPGRLLNYELIDSSAGRRLRWHWIYPDLPVLKGFRLFQDGALVAGEDVLAKTNRSWTSPPLKPGTVKFELHSVAIDGTLAPAGPPQQYEVFQ